ncbi:cilia- and flagella-associated protein 337-like isoform X3 [Lithobates pipiens]
MPLPPLLQKRALALQRQLLSASLLQELETFLKTKGVQKSDTQHGSFNDEENVLSFDRNENMRLEEKFRLDDLLRLEEIFANHNQHEEKTEVMGGRRKAVLGPQRVGNMTLIEFQKVLSDLFGSQFWDNNMELLFNKVDTSCDGFIDWSEFCTYMLLQYKEREVMMTQRASVLGEPLIRLCTLSKQEPTCRILAIGGPPSFWFMSVSKGGVLTAWDGNLNPMRSYEISSDLHDPQAGKRRFKSWTTDAIYLPNLHKFTVATTSRSIHFFDISTMNVSEEFYLCALQHIPTCFSYWHNGKTPGSSSLLLWGDDKGGVNLLWLLKPTSGLFEKPFSQDPGPHKISMQDLRHHSNFLGYQSIPNVHSEPVTRLLYIPGQELIISASGSSKTSVVIMDIHRRGRVYTWKISKGVQCFDFCKAMNLLVTGGLDHQVRLWNQYVPGHPTAVFSEHTMPILDVVVYEPLKQIFSYSKDSVLKIWDISSHSCLQTLVLKFPCIQPGRIQEQGNFPFLLVPSPSHCLLVAYCDYIAMLRLAQKCSNEEVLATHEAPLSAVLYNGFFHQVVTASEDSNIAVWDVETGDKFLLLRNAHGQEEVTCLSLDTSKRRLISGAQNGTIKIWNIQNGHNLHRLQPVEEVEVTGVLALREHTVLSVGWNRKIVTYNVTKTENMYVPAKEGWKGGHLHKDDIMAADYCPSLGLLVTASFDGEIIVWNVETQRLYLYLRKCPLYRQSSRGRAGSRYCQRGRSGDLGCPLPVDRLLFLQYRAAQREGAVLISSEGGVLCWWSIFTPDSIFGSFYAPGEADESVFGMASDDTNHLLVSGDTSGYIQVWDISQYNLHPQDQAKGVRPPLLFSWAAHSGTVVSLEIFQFEGEPFIVSGSCDRTAKLWTCNGSHVGTFGQSRTWNLKKPSSFQQNKVRRSRTTEDPNVLPEGLQSHSGEEGAVPGGTVQRGSPLLELDSELMCDVADNEEESSLVVSFPENHMKVSAGRKQSKRFPIDLNKCSLYGQLCTPFQALHVAEMAEVPSISRGLSGLGTSDFWWPQQGESHRDPKTQDKQSSQNLQSLNRRGSHLLSLPPHSC